MNEFILASKFRIVWQVKTWKVSIRLLNDNVNAQASIVNCFINGNLQQFSFNSEANDVILTNNKFDNSITDQTKFA